MSEKRFTYGETIDYNFFDVFEEKKYLGMVQRDSTKIVDRLNEQQATITALKKENDNLKLKIVSLENEIQRQNNELKNTRKEFTKKTEELNWLKSEDYLKKIY